LCLPNRPSYILVTLFGGFLLERPSMSWMNRSYAVSSGCFQLSPLAH